MELGESPSIPNFIYVLSPLCVVRMIRLAACRREKGKPIQDNYSRWCALSQGVFCK